MSRQKEGLYFVGKKEYWFTRQNDSFMYLHKMLRHADGRSDAWGRPAFVVESSCFVAHIEAI